MLAGLAGTVLPVLPGTLLVFAGLFIAAWADGFAHVGMAGLAIIGTLGVLAFVADFVASLAGAKRVGASPQALAVYRSWVTARHGTAALRPRTIGW